tara:strand:- start:117 stop:524 length:408 start_codon:yes stop_codon:yes gene_type:complete
MLLLKHKKEIVDNLEAICKMTPLSDYSMGMLIRSAHYNGPFLLLLVVLFSTKSLALAAIIFCTMVIICWVLLGGCLLSMLEHRLCKDKFNVVDPFLEISSIEINYNTRKNISYFLGVFYILTIYTIFIFRFVATK